MYGRHVSYQWDDVSSYKNAKVDYMLLNNTDYVLRLVPVELREQWDSFIAEHPCGHLLQSWAWGDLKAQSGWHPLRLALWNKEKQQIMAAAQVLQRTVTAVPLWAGHLAYIPKGPIIDWSQASLREMFFSQLDRYLRKQGALALQMELGQDVSAANSELILKCLAELPAYPTRAIQPLRTIVLDLTPDEDTLLAQMKEKCRYNVRLAGRKGVTIRVADSREDVQAWYKLLQTTGERDRFGIHAFDYYLRVWELFGSLHQVQLWLAEHNGQLLAGIFVGLFARQAMYLYGASSNEQRQLMPNYLLQWEAIRWAKQQGATLYDFWGIPETDVENEAMAGVYRFKRSWGGQVVQFLGCYERVYHPLRMKIAKRLT